jgi:tRNA threonylcarbamoyladenosine biosynthesis protein TsaE
MSPASRARSGSGGNETEITLQGEGRIITEAVRRYLADHDATMHAGSALAPGLQGGMIVTLSGELGSGKTTLVRGMLRGLGWQGPVKSPSFALVEHYQFPSLYFYHFDFYRVEDSQEWDSAGFAEYFRPDAVAVIEWPERVIRRLRDVDMAAKLEHAEPGRNLELLARTEAGKACLARFARAMA